MLMDYIPNDVDGLVVAGGRGTMLEVVSGLLTRKDKAQKDLQNGLSLYCCVTA